MDEKRTERTPTSTHTTINRTQDKPSGGGVMWFLLGGIVVVIAIVAYLVMGQDGPTISGGSQPTGGNTSINIETRDAPAPQAAPTEPAPAPAQTAPAEPAPAAPQGN